MPRRRLLNVLTSARGLGWNTDQGRRARTLAALLLMLIVLGSIGVYLEFQVGLGVPWFYPEAIASIFLLIVPYAVVRAGYVRAAAWLLIAISALVPVSALFLHALDSVTLAFFLLPMVLGSVLLPVRQVSWFIPALLLAVVTAAVTRTPPGGFPTGLVETLVLVFMVAGLLFVGVHYRARIEEIRRTELSESERNFRALAENASDAILVIQQGVIEFANHRAAKLSGYKLDELLGTPMIRHIHPEHADMVLDRYRRRLAGVSVPGRYEMQVLDSKGEVLPVEVTASVTTWRGEAADLVAMRDIRERVRSEAQMRKLSSALEQTADAVMITDRDGAIEYVNPAFEAITGYERAEVIGRTPAILKSDRQSERFFRQLWESISRGEVFADVFINRRKDGTLYYEEKNITPLKNEQGQITHFIATGKDISERVRTQERLEYLAHHDSLTGLPNRVLFMDRLKQALARARWHHQRVALMFIDLDRFKGVNDTLGHDAGDELLRALAARLRQVLGDQYTIARLGGDEFAVILADMQSDDEVADLAEGLLASFREAFDVEQRELYVTASMGISLYPADGETVGTLLRNADIAMYKAKDLGKNTFQFYAADMSMRAFERLNLETSLRRALSRDQFELFYQPQVDLETGCVIGVEALLRWRHPEMDTIGPSDFIGLLEDTGLILEVGRWVLREACIQARTWRDELPEHWWVTVNVSGLQLSGGDSFLRTVEEVLAETGFDPERLELEITESVLMHDTDRALQTLEALNRRGVRLAIDDFGTGYSSLAYLKRFPIDTLKIDRTFVRDVPDDSDDRAIVRSIIALAHSLNLSVVAEGVETERQLDFLRHQGCEAAQGYLVTRPLPAAELPDFVRGWHNRARRA